jgi:hypothetical protein
MEALEFAKKEHKEAHDEEKKKGAECKIKEKELELAEQEAHSDNLHALKKGDKDVAANAKRDGANKKLAQA